MIVLGGSVHGLTLAAAAAQRGLRVTLVSPPDKHEPRLVSGCSLRRSTLAILARAFATSVPELLADFRGHQSCFVALEMREVPLGGRALLYESDRHIGLSSRHGYILEVLRKRLPTSVERVQASVQKLTEREIVLDAGALAFGDELVVNCTPRPLTVSPPKPKHVVTAVQCPMRFRPGRERPRVAFAPWLTGEERPHLAFYTPFYDPAWPEATFYGINTSVERAEGHDRAAALKDVRARLYEMGEAYGLEAVGGEAALGEAVVPVVREFTCASRVIEGAVELSSGAPAILLDGMLAGARGAEAIADAVAAGGDVRKSIHRSLATIRARNRAAQQQFYFAPAFVRKVAQAISPKWLMRKNTEDMANLGLQS